MVNLVDLLEERNELKDYIHDLQTELNDLKNQYNSIDAKIQSMCDHKKLIKFSIFDGHRTDNYYECTMCGADTCCKKDSIITAIRS